MNCPIIYLSSARGKVVTIQAAKGCFVKTLAAPVSSSFFSSSCMRVSNWSVLLLFLYSTFSAFSLLITFCSLSTCTIREALPELDEHLASKHLAWHLHKSSILSTCLQLCVLAHCACDCTCDNLTDAALVLLLVSGHANNKCNTAH